MKIAKCILVLFVVILAFSCARVVHETRLSYGPSEAKWVKRVMSEMTLEEKIGQMMICPYSGRFLNRESEDMKDLESLVLKRKIGGLILYGGNVYETALLTNRLQNLSEIPLLISSDLERGLGNQIDGATQFPPLMALGAIGAEEQAYLMGKVTAVEGRAIGIHLTYAPVVDVNINPDNPIINVRSFGEDPEQVSRLAAAFIRGCQENGFLATAKHFPGHGDTNMDSHSELPTVTGDAERLERVELFPFRKAVEAGVSVIMTAHIHLPALDPAPDMPATLSPRILSDLLRHEMGFKGLLVTDAMDMGGVTTLYSPEEAAVKAVQAGVDMILKSPEQEAVIDALIQAAKKGEIRAARIDESVRRILEAKARLGLHKNRLVSIEKLDKVIAARQHLDLAQQMFENSITLVKNENKILPLPESEMKIAVLSLSSDPGRYFAGRPLIEEMEERGLNISSFYADAFTGEKYLKEGMEKAKEADVIIFALFSVTQTRKGSVGLNENHIQMVKEAAAGSIPVVVISFGSPYFIRNFPEIDSYLCAYRWSSEAQITAVKALFGEIDLMGRLPVTIPELYPIGYGIELPKKEETSKE
jgi:beta-N-acetylhexosaminidase